MTSKDTVGARRYIVPSFAEGGRPDLRSVVIWMDGVIAAQVIEQGGLDLESLISIREEVKALADGGPLTEYGFYCACTAMTYVFHEKAPSPEEEFIVAIRNLRSK